MPGIRHQCSGIHTFRMIFSILKHCFFRNNRQYCRCCCKQSRRLQMCIISRYNIFDSSIANSNTGKAQNICKQKCRNALQPFMSIWMLLIRSLCRQLHSNDHNNTAKHIRCRMNRITDHRSGMSDHTG